MERHNPSIQHWSLRGRGTLGFLGPCNWKLPRKSSIFPLRTNPGWNWKFTPKSSIFLKILNFFSLQKFRGSSKYFEDLDPQNILRKKPPNIKYWGLGLQGVSEGIACAFKCSLGCRGRRWRRRGWRWRRRGRSCRGNWRHPTGHVSVVLSAPKSQRFLRFAIAMPIADPRNRAIPETRQTMLHCDLRVRWKVASDLRFRAAISEPKTPSFCGISGDLAQSTRKSLAIAIVRFWCAKALSLTDSKDTILGTEKYLPPPPREQEKKTFRGKLWLHPPLR